jgi:hypothetical protein
MYALFQEAAGRKPAGCRISRRFRNPGTPQRRYRQLSQWPQLLQGASPFISSL